VITTGGLLPARHVIHTVGPVWDGGDFGESELLASAYRNSLRLAEENDVPSISFPAISAGTYGYPIDQAARIALETTAEYLRGHTGGRLRRILFVLFSEEDLQVYRSALSGALGA